MIETPCMYTVYCSEVTRSRPVSVYIEYNNHLHDYHQNVWMWIFGSITSVIVSLKIASRYYKKMYPRMKLISTELVLLPFGFVWICLAPTKSTRSHNAVCAGLICLFISSGSKSVSMQSQSFSSSVSNHLSVRHSVKHHPI